MSLLHRNPVLDPYYAETSSALKAWRIMDRAGRVVDIVRTPAVAKYDVDALNAGRARVDQHACLGCRVVVEAAA